MKIERLVIIPDYKEEFKSWHPGPTVKAMEMKDLCKYSYQAYFYLTYYTPIENPEERLASSKPFFFMTNTYLKVK
ncbi:hypothetical protein HDV02_004160 [Globomyces sp. JEL0801]|nr:hypothetical protein HDV02_004160 [Globomyces sp. JEL0801]